MILTVTPDPALDKVIFIDAWTPGVAMRSDKVTLSVGGKGLDASVALSCLGVETAGLCFLAGRTGGHLLEQLQRYVIQVFPVWVEGETRLAHVIVERRSQRHSHLFTGGIQVTPAQQDALWQQLDRLLPRASFLCSGGVLPASLPGDFFADLTRRAQIAGVPVLLDTRLHYLRPALPTCPSIVKMNQAEFCQTFDLPGENLPDLLASAAQIHQHYALASLVITCGAAGILAFTPEGVYHARPPEQVVVSAAGAGDAASAALAWRLSLGESWLDALRWAAAASAAAVLTEGTGDLLLEDVQRILPQVEIELRQQV